jgi:hypothetical protein
MIDGPRRSIGQMVRLEIPLARGDRLENQSGCGGEVEGGGWNMAAAVAAADSWRRRRGASSAARPRHSSPA